jgi:hypothetical protein
MTQSTCPVDAEKRRVENEFPQKITIIVAYNIIA